ncbi:MAG: class I SAM-dependent methyltransferase [Alphaproteobacteria bacterium]|jgi:ubiquinone/menaquinone biosynthesis C-methylase UbiE|nr:class I SAM-dependent methyltransferase [Alphaproteobacteria bacterium]HJP23667.1 class I SAM-dependent methyltransferase [Alphaproteobacteria bacterium]
MAERKILDAASDIEALDLLLTVTGLDLVDVGCGAGNLSRQLVQRGARVLGVDPDAIQAAKNSEAPAEAGLRFAEAPATELPLMDASQDGVILSRSLHHMAIDEMEPALREAARVLKPTGFLYVLEPDYSGSYWELQKSYNNESPARLAAIETLNRAAPALFGELQEYWYDLPVTFPDFDTYLETTLDRSYLKFERHQIDTPEVRARFAAARGEDGHHFDQPIRLRIYGRTGND